DGAAVRARDGCQLAADRARAVSHDVHAHAAARGLRTLEADAVILDRQRQIVRDDLRANVDPRRLAVLYRVRHDFLRNAIEIVRALLAELIELRSGVHAALDTEHRLRTRRELLERMPQRHAGLARYGAQAARELGGLRDRLVDQIDRLLKIRAVETCVRRKLPTERLEHQLHAGQDLPEAVVQVVPDVIALALDAAHDLPLEVHALRHVRDGDHDLILAD